MQWKDDTTLRSRGLSRSEAKPNLRAKIEHGRPCLPYFPKSRLLGLSAGALQMPTLPVDLSPLVLRAAGGCRLRLPDGWQLCRFLCGRLDLGFGELAAQVC